MTRALNLRNMQQLNQFALSTQTGIVVDAIQNELNFLASDESAEQFETQIKEMHDHINYLNALTDPGLLQEFLEEHHYMAESLSDQIQANK